MNGQPVQSEQTYIPIGQMTSRLMNSPADCYILRSTMTPSAPDPGI